MTMQEESNKKTISIVFNSCSICDSRTENSSFQLNDWLKELHANFLEEKVKARGAVTNIDTALCSNCKQETIKVTLIW